MESDAEIVVGARNEASAIFQEIGDQLRALAMPAEQGAARADAAIGSLVAGIARSAAAMTGIFGAIGLGIGGIATASAVKAINDQSEAMDSLNRRLDNYVGANRLSEDAARSFADEVRRNLGVSEAQTLSLMEQAAAAGVHQSKMDDAALAAIGLSRALGIDMDSALKKVLEGDEKLVSMLSSVNRGLTEQGEQVKGIAGLWNLVELQTKKTIEFIAASTQPLQESFSQLGQFIQDSVVAGVVGAVTAVELFRDKTGVVLAFAGTAFELWAIQIEEITKHAFTVAMPAYVVWFTDNMVNLFVDGFNLLSAYFRNLTMAWAQAFAALWEYIRTGGKSGLADLQNDLLLAAGTLLDGFESQASALPDVMRRSIGAREAELKDQLGTLGNALGQSFNERFQKNMEGVKLTTPQFNQIPDFSTPDEKDKAASKQGDLRATESRLLTRGPAEKGIDKIASATEASKNLLQQIRDKLSESPAANVALEVIGLGGLV